MDSPCIKQTVCKVFKIFQCGKYLVAYVLKVDILFLACDSVNTFHASGDFCRLLITFANSLEPDQDRQNVGPDLDPHRFTV